MTVHTADNRVSAEDIVRWLDGHKNIEIWLEDRGRRCCLQYSDASTGWRSKRIYAYDPSSAIIKAIQEAE